MVRCVRFHLSAMRSAPHLWLTIAHMIGTRCHAIRCFSLRLTLLPLQLKPIRMLFYDSQHLFLCDVLPFWARLKLRS